MNKKTLKIGSLVLALVLMIASLGGIGAYFTDTDTATNTFTIGEVSIQLLERNWPGDTDTTPNATTSKDPQIFNDGTNDAYVYLEVIIPYQDDLVTVNVDGTINAAKDTELFNYTVNSGWFEVTTTTDENAGVVKHVYAYVGDDNTELQVLIAGSTTPTLFDNITFVNAIENQGLEGSDLEVVINAYAIQTTNINGGITDPVDVWEVITNTGIADGVESCDHIDRDSDNVCDTCGTASDFASYSWAEIAAYCQNDNIPSTWAVGNVKEMEINGASYTVAIIGKDHDEYADGSGVAPLTFQVVDIVTTHNMNDTNTNTGSWDGSAMYSFLNDDGTGLINSLPTEVSSNIKSVTKYTNLGGADTNNYATTTAASSNKLFLLADAEITGDGFWTWYNDELIPFIIANDMADASDEEKAAVAEMYANFCAAMKAEGDQYTYYSALGNVATVPTVEELLNAYDLNYWYSMSHATLEGLDDVAASWWLRSPYPSSSIDFDYIDSTGFIDDSGGASAVLGVSFGFCF